MQSVFIKGRFPGLNEIILTARTNRYKSASEKKKYTEIVRYSVLHLYPVESADFIFTWYEKDKRRNPDNIASAKKFCFDGLQAAGIIKNDGWKEIKSFKDQFEVSKIEGVLIEIMEAKS